MKRSISILFTFLIFILALNNMNFAKCKLEKSVQESMPIIAPVVFTWKQVGGPWFPLDGFDDIGTRNYWERHINYISEAGFNAVIVNLIWDSEIFTNNLIDVAINRQIKLIPFIAAEGFSCYFCSKTQEEFEQQTLYWLLFLKNNTGSRFNEIFVHFENKLFLLYWWPGDGCENIDLNKLKQKVKAQLGIDLYISAHTCFRQPDEYNYLFNGMEGVKFNEKGNVDLLVGYWPVEKERANIFALRQGGKNYFEVWKTVIENITATGKIPKFIFIESYNEISEGSGLLPIHPNSYYHSVNDQHPEFGPECFYRPCHNVYLNDFFIDTNLFPLPPEKRPFLYLQD